MNAYIVSFLLGGFFFGVVSFPIRHLFSEGPTQVQLSDGPGSLQERIFWSLICTCLWPILLLTGLHSAWIIAKKRRAALSESRGSSV
jgi:hypothetical protein